MWPPVCVMIDKPALLCLNSHSYVAVIFGSLCCRATPRKPQTAERADDKAQRTGCLINILCQALTVHSSVKYFTLTGQRHSEMRC